MENIFLLAYLAIWAYSIYYCRKVAEIISARKDVALIVSFFLPVPALILYYYYSIKHKKVVEK